MWRFPAWLRLAAALFVAFGLVVPVAVPMAMAMPAAPDISAASFPWGEICHADSSDDGPAAPQPAPAQDQGQYHCPLCHLGGLAFLGADAIRLPVSIRVAIVEQPLISITAAQTIFRPPYTSRAPPLIG